MIAQSNDGNVLELPGRPEAGLDRRQTGNLVTHTVTPVVDFSHMTSIKALFMAWRKFSRGKGSRQDVQLFRRNLTKYIHLLHAELSQGSYQHGSYQPFTICDPKQRSIHKASVRDRLVHQAVVSALEPLFDKQFIHDSYSCRLNKGTHAGVRRLRSFLRKASRNNTKTVYVLKCDVRKFFDSVDHAVLLELIERRVGDPQAIELVRIILASFSRRPGKGLPLGNVTSQLFANVYMHEFDFFVKQRLREKYYIRYCDDFIIIHEDKRHLAALVQVIADFLQSRLLLQLHPHKVSVRSYHQGIDFLGYVLKPQATLIRSKTRLRMLKRATPHNIHSYLGVCSHANSHTLRRTLLSKTWQNKLGTDSSVLQ